ncbi:hypothetical protein KUCAC02_037422 [Chaenocephalus aceratus]|nr:hypothetical protein KUCAC02_037422 [Chaenocephalus aceratus]
MEDALKQNGGCFGAEWRMLWSKMEDALEQRCRECDSCFESASLLTLAVFLWSCRTMTPLRVIEQKGCGRSLSSQPRSREGNTSLGVLRPLSVLTASVQRRKHLLRSPAAALCPHSLGPEKETPPEESCGRSLSSQPRSREGNTSRGVLRPLSVLTASVQRRKHLQRSPAAALCPHSLGPEKETPPEESCGRSLSSQPRSREGNTSRGVLRPLGQSLRPFLDLSCVFMTCCRSLLIPRVGNRVIV